MAFGLTRIAFGILCVPREDRSCGLLGRLNPWVTVGLVLGFDDSALDSHGFRDIAFASASAILLFDLSAIDPLPHVSFMCMSPMELGIAPCTHTDRHNFCFVLTSKNNNIVAVHT